MLCWLRETAGSADCSFPFLWPPAACHHIQWSARQPVKLRQVQVVARHVPDHNIFSPHFICIVCRNQDTIGVRTLGAADLALLGPEGHTLSRAADTIPVPPLASLAPGAWGGVPHCRHAALTAFQHVMQSQSKQHCFAGLEHAATAQRTRTIGEVHVSSHHHTEWQPPALACPSRQG